MQHDQDINPSVYLVSALLWMASIAWLPWKFAHVIWCAVSLLVWVLALWRILQQLPILPSAKWLIAAAALAFSPSYVGIYAGNPSVLTIALVTLAILSRSPAAAAALLGIALCFKPQIALCGVLTFVIWKRWRTLFASCAVFVMCLVAGTAQHSAWWQTEQRNVIVSFQPGGQSDPASASHVAWQFLNAQTLVAYAFHNRALWNVAVWLLGAALLLLFLHSGRGSRWKTVAFFSALTLLLTYHRYYDAQLLLLTIPFLVELWRKGQRQAVLIAAVCLLTLAFPIQSILARHLGTAALAPSLKQFILLRNQPLAILTLAILLASAPPPNQLLTKSSDAEFMQ